MLDITDVQESSLQLQVDYDRNFVGINCRLIPGSRAMGCVLVLDGTLDSDEIRIARGDDILKEYDPERLGKVTFFLYDWEEDGSVGNVSVPVNVTTISIDPTDEVTSEGEEASKRN